MRMPPMLVFYFSDDEVDDALSIDSSHKSTQPRARELPITGGRPACLRTFAAKSAGKV